VLDEYGLTWPWESLHIEALAWYDQWLKDRDTGVLEGPKFRYVLPGEGEWHATEAWPVPARYEPFALGADGVLGGDAVMAGERQMMSLGIGFDRPHASESDPPAMLTWTSAPLEHDTDVLGPIELRVDATHTAPDTAWIVVLQDVAPNGAVHEVTAAYLRAGLRRWDEAASREGAPVLPYDRFEPLLIGEPVAYRIPLVPIARRFAAGHSIRLLVTANDQDSSVPALMNFRHASAGTSCLTTIFSTSTLLLPLSR
jgi:predicted acyl esterase